MTRKQTYLQGYDDGRRYARLFYSKHGRQPSIEEIHDRIDRQIMRHHLEEDVTRFSYR